MRIDKKKVVFASIVFIVLVFIVCYTMLVLIEEKPPAGLEQTLVPKLKEEQEEYTSKIDALNDIKEERERTIPSVYSEHFLDSLDAYAPAIELSQRDWKIDSVYHLGNIPFEQENGVFQEEEDFEEPEEIQKIIEAQVEVKKDLSAGHQIFFLNSQIPDTSQAGNFYQEMRAQINGNQTIESGDRLELILTHDAVIDGKFFPKNYLVYGIVNVQHNRLNIQITHVGGKEVRLKAYDLQDSNEGIYIENSFRAEAGREVAADLVDNINLTGLPQIGGIKNIFRKNNRRVKVTVLDQYQLILKSIK